MSLLLEEDGGSLEDLWPFNEEIVARSIYASKIPIISAVGHETDFTISDFVADLRAPTPSAAAELAVTDIEDLKYDLGLQKRRLKMALKAKTQVMRFRYEKCMHSRVYQNPLQRINDGYLLLDKYIKSLENSSIQKIKACQLVMAKHLAKLDVLSPLKTLTRGYSITNLKENKKVIKSIHDVKSGDVLEIRVEDGTIEATVNEN